MYKWLFAVTLPVLLGVGPPAAPDEEYQALEQAFNAAQQKYYEAMEQWFQAADSQPASHPAAETRPSEPPKPPAAEFLPKFRAYADKHLGEPAALPALSWLLTNGPRIGYEQGATPPDVEWALTQLTKKYAESPDLADTLRQLRYSASDVGREPLIVLYKKVIAENKDKEVLGAATFNLACLYYEQSDMELLEPAAEGAEKPKDTAEQGQAKPRVTDAKKQAEVLLRRVVSDYPDTKAAKAAVPFIFEIEHLQIGMTAPEIAGADANGQDIKLSELRGRVVVLDFWGFW